MLVGVASRTFCRRWAACTERETALVLLYPAADVPGEWVAHVLDYDLVTQGRLPDHAVEMAEEALAIVLSEGGTRRRAPEEEWQRAYGVMRDGQPVKGTLDEGGWDRWCADLGPGFAVALQRPSPPKRDDAKFAQNRAAMNRRDRWQRCNCSRKIAGRKAPRFFSCHV